jgi:hypothetical protein
MKTWIAKLFILLFLISIFGLGACSRHKCPAQTGGYVAPPPKVGKHHKPQSGLWGPGMKKKN